VAFQGISPNGDGKNDFLVIPGVMRTTPNRLTVYDRIGNIVFEVKISEWEDFPMVGVIL
jgi:gliding motility-associated-like protein